MELKKKKRLIDKNEVPTYQTTIHGVCVLEVEAGTNGKKGGDSSHGSRTYLRLTDLASTDIEARVIESDDENNHGNGLEITLGGDGELTAFINALDYASTVLKAQKENREVKKELIKFYDTDVFN